VTSNDTRDVIGVVAEATVASIIALVSRLRASGLPVSTGEVLDAMNAIATVDVASRPLVRIALRSTLVKDSAKFAEFDRAFDAVFPRVRVARPEAQIVGKSSDEPESSGALETEDLVRAMQEGDLERVRHLLESAVDAYSGVVAERSVEHHTQRVLRRMDLAEIHRRYLDTDQDRSELDRSIAAAEAQRALDEIRKLIEQMVTDRLPPAGPTRADGDIADLDLLHASADELLRLRQALRPLARRLASRLGQRRRRGRGTLDMRRTIRASIGTGGVPVAPVLRRRRPTRPGLVVLCDVSGSTAEFAPFILALLHAVHQEFSRVRSFVFVDGVVEISELLDSSPGVIDPRHLLDRRGLVVGDGRSDYRRALRGFLDVYSDSVTARTTVLIVGDTRSHERAPALAEVAEIAKVARRLYLFNPEPMAEWDTGDSRCGEYALLSNAVFEVSTLRQLVESVAAIA